MKKSTLLYYLFGFATFLISCGDDDVPGKENEEEIIDKVTLTFTPSEGNPIVITATDPDGEGVANMTPDGVITLLPSTTYTLTIGVENTIGEIDIAEEIAAEDDEHMFFFSFSENIFSNPNGNGNADNRTDAINYNDQDENGLPLGLSTTWTTGSENTADNAFTVILKHQPGLKSSTSSTADGSTDINISWTIYITNAPL